MEEQGQERPGRSTELPGPDALQALATLKVELRSEHEKSCRAYFWFMHKNHQRRKPDLVWRSVDVFDTPTKTGIFQRASLAGAICFFKPNLMASNIPK